MVAPTQHEIELVLSDIKAAVLDFMRQEEMRQSELRNKSTARFTAIASLGAAAIIAAIVSIGQWYLNVLQSTIKADAASAARIAALDEIRQAIEYCFRCSARSNLQNRKS